MGQPYSDTVSALTATVTAISVFDRGGAEQRASVGAGQIARLRCVVTMTHSGYWAKQSHSHATFDKSMSSTARDFRQLTPLVLMGALERAGTTVCEPVHRITLEIPPDTLGATAGALAALRGVRLRTDRRGAACVVEGEIPAARVHELTQQLPSLTRGEGVLESAFDRYEPIRGQVPTRPRTDYDPLDREEYIRRILRRYPPPQDG
jgi:ribosomal protection tetracycline resistance protein